MIAKSQKPQNFLNLFMKSLSPYKAYNLYMKSPFSMETQQKDRKKPHPFRIGLRLQASPCTVQATQLVRSITLLAERILSSKDRLLIPLGRSPDSRLPIRLAFPSSHFPFLQVPSK